MKFLLIPENNSLSHLNKCIALKRKFDSSGHETHIAVNNNRSDFLKKLNINHHVVTSIQELIGNGFPTFSWFKNTDIIAGIIKEEVELINKIKPDRIIGIMRFTLFASSEITGIPYDSLISGCMLPDTEEVLGFKKNEAEIETQKFFLMNFFHYAAVKLSKAFSLFGIKKINDLREALIGKTTFLWDFPEFLNIQKKQKYIYTGPLSENFWPYDDFNIDDFLKDNKPIAVLSFGTCNNNLNIIKRLTGILIKTGYKVIIALGGQKNFDLNFENKNIKILNYAPLDKIFPYTTVLITHGGQMTVFEALKNKIPVAVLPFQPEQAHNGVCLERTGCGIKLIPAVVFTGHSEVYEEAFNNLSDKEITDKIQNLVNDQNVKFNLNGINVIMNKYKGIETINAFYKELN